MKASHAFMFSLCLLLSACGDKQVDQASPGADAPPPPEASMEVAELPSDGGEQVQTLPGDSGAPGDAGKPVAGFDIAQVPITDVALPPFPLFKDPEGQTNVQYERTREIPFDRHYFIAGNTLRAEEGKISVAMYNLEYPPNDGRRYSPLEFHRNYEEAIASLGGKRVDEVQYTDEFVKANGGRPELEKYYRGAGAGDWNTENRTYVIRSPDKEYWINISTGRVPQHGFVVVLEKQAMKSKLAFVDAAAMKKALDADGRVALYINFDVDKATLRPDAQPVIEEIQKLLDADAALKLSIEGHTDSTGSADHNRKLSTARARSVLGALVGLGVDPTRLSSQGFGPDKPLADNGSEQGRAKNRRVELVKKP